METGQETASGGANAPAAVRENPLVRRLQYEYATDEVDGEVERQLMKMGRTLKMKGFRPGRAPLRLLKQQYGGKCLDEVLIHRARHSFQESQEVQATDAERPALPPHFVAAPRAADGRYRVECHFEVLPAILPPDFSGRKLLRPILSIGDDQVQQMIERLQRNHGRYCPVSRPAAKDDAVLVDFKAFLGDELLEEGKNRRWILGGAMLQGEVGDQLAGAGAGDRREAVVVHPDDHPREKLRGAKVRLQISIHGVEELQLPDLDEEFFRLHGVEECGLAAFRENVKNNLETEVARRLGETFHARALNLLIEATPKFDLPQSLMQMEIAGLYRRAGEECKRQGLAQMAAQLMPRPFVPEAWRRVALGLILAEWRRRESPSVSDESIDAKLRAMAADYDSSAVDAFVARARADGRVLESVKLSLLEEQVVAAVAAAVTVEEETVPLSRLLGEEEE